MDAACNLCCNVYEAVEHGHLTCLNKLVTEEADVNIHGAAFTTYLLSRNADFFDSGSTQTALMLAVGLGRERCVETILTADVNATGSSGETALMKAVLSDSNKCVEMLFNAGTNANAKTLLGETALIKAATAGKNKSVELLLKAGANVKMTDKQGNTALVEAANKNKVLC